MGVMNKVVARELRKNMTDAEKTLWRYLRFKQMSGYKFRRQCAIGKFVVDFVCFEKKLIIELDGGQHVEQEPHDAARTKWLENQGFHVLRFWNHEVLTETEAVLEKITPHLNPPPQGGRRVLSAGSQ